MNIFANRTTLGVALVLLVFLSTGITASIPGVEGPGTRMASQQDPPSEDDRVTFLVVRSRASETIKIIVKLPEESDQVSITLYNLLGRKIISLPIRSAPKGETTYQIDTHDLPDGHYFAVVETLGQRLTKKVFVYR